LGNSPNIVKNHYFEIVDGEAAESIGHSNRCCGLIAKSLPSLADAKIGIPLHRILCLGSNPSEAELKSQNRLPRKRSERRALFLQLFSAEHRSAVSRNVSRL